MLMEFFPSEYNLWYPFLNFTYLLLLLLIHLFILFLKIFKKMYLFIFGCGGSSLRHLGFLQLQWAGAADSSTFSGFRAEAPGVQAQYCGAQA